MNCLQFCFASFNMFFSVIWSCLSRSPATQSQRPGADPLKFCAFGCPMYCIRFHIYIILVVYIILYIYNVCFFSEHNCRKSRDLHKGCSQLYNNHTSSYITIHHHTSPYITFRQRNQISSCCEYTGLDRGTRLTLQVSVQTPEGQW